MKGQVLHRVRASGLIISLKFSSPLITVIELIMVIELSRVKFGL